ncbi:MAG: helix-turn-helix domain-containing protein [Zetaproteobacteria bacterium]|nr:helix-turn-helix domain-containing protein [Zetaproteobacteria bacterium]
MDKGLLTVQEVCNLLRVHPNTVYNWIRSGRLSAFKVGRAWRIPTPWDFSPEEREALRCLSE